MDSQPEDQVTVQVQTPENPLVTIQVPTIEKNQIKSSPNNTTNAITSQENLNDNPSNDNFLHADVHNDNDSVNSFDSTDDDEHHQPPVCTVSVQIRSCDSVSRLTRIRQAEKHRLSLTLSDEQDNSDMSDANVSENEQEQDVVGNAEEVTPVAGGTSGDILNDGQLDRTKDIDEAVMDKEEVTPVICQVVENAENDKNVDGSQTEAVKNRKTIDEMKGNYEKKDEIKDTIENKQSIEYKNESSDSITELNHFETKKISGNKNSSKKSLSHQSSKEKKAKFKKQRSLVEMSVEWMFQKLTGKVGEQLDLPWVYYFAFTVLCACFAAAVRLNPLYMILIVAVLSFLSFRFLSCEDMSECEIEHVEDIEENTGIESTVC